MFRFHGPPLPRRSFAFNRVLPGSADISSASRPTERARPRSLGEPIGLARGWRQADTPKHGMQRAGMSYWRRRRAGTSENAGQRALSRGSTIWLSCRRLVCAIGRGRVGACLISERRGVVQPAKCIYICRRCHVSIGIFDATRSKGQIDAVMVGHGCSRHWLDRSGWTRKSRRC